MVLKLDIEGGEYQVLPDLIERDLHRTLDVMYIEFHSHYMADPQLAQYAQREQAILAQLTRDQVCHRIWI